MALRSAGQMAGLAGAWWWLERAGSGTPWWWAVGAVVAALAIPRTLADAWHEFVHEPRFGLDPVARTSFAATVLGRLAMEGGALTLAFALLDRTDGLGWFLVGAAGLVAAVPLTSGLIGPRIALLVHRAVDVPGEHEAHAHVGAIAAAYRLPKPRIVALDPSSFAGTNAYVTGHGSGLTVAVSHRLLEGPDDLLRHVVGHEMEHIRQRHLLWSTLAAATSVGVTALLALTVAVEVADSAARLPVVVIAALVASVPFRFALAWLSRANERQADRAALRLAPIPPALIKQLHLSDRPLLEPNRLARWHSSHPVPAERLEAAARHGDSHHAT